MDQDEVKVHKLAKKERGQYPAILTEQAWSIKDLLYGIRHQKSEKFFLRDKARNPKRARSLHLARSGRQSQRGIWFILRARGATHITTTLTASFDNWLNKLQNTVPLTSLY